MDVDTRFRIPTQERAKQQTGGKEEKSEEQSEWEQEKGHRELDTTARGTVSALPFLLTGNEKGKHSR